MNNQHLITLIKLQEGHLSDAAGLQVRKQLATNHLLLQHWKQLTSLYGNQTSCDLLAPFDEGEFDAEFVAAFAEESMNLEQQQQFESACWEKTELLSEVIAAYRAVHADVSEQAQPNEFSSTSNRMQNVSMQNCSPSISLSDHSDYFQEIKEHLPTTLNGTAPTSLNLDVDLLELVSQPINILTNTPTPPTQPQTQSSQRWLVIAVSVVFIAIAIPTYFAFFLNNDSERMPIAKQPPGSTTDDQSPINNNPHHQTIPKLVEGPKPIPGGDPASKDPHTLPSNMTKNDNNTTVVVKKEETKESNKRLEFQFTWNHKSGIIGYRKHQPGVWQGILADATSKLSQTISVKENLILCTLPSSWLEGTIQNHSHLVIAEETKLEITLLEPKEETSPTTINLQLHKGKVAFSQLQAGERVILINNEQKWTIQANENETSVGFIYQEAGNRKIITFSGEIQVSSGLTESSQQSLKTTRVQENQMIQVDMRTISNPEKTIHNNRWLTKPPKVLKLNKSFIKNLNQSQHLLADLFAAPANATEKELLVSTNLSFSLNSVAAVPRATRSKKEVQRVAAIEWLIAAKENSQTEAIWNKVSKKSASSQPQISLRRWFQAAQKKAPASQRHLTDLSSGLKATQPLFVRQCSIHFLRTITKLRLSEYNPNKPTNKSINSVRQAVRRVTSNGRRTR